MEATTHFECDTLDCIHSEGGVCVKPGIVTIQEHCCIDYEERLLFPAGTVTIEVSGGVVQNVYASPDLPVERVELIDFDNLNSEPETIRKRAARLLDLAAKEHTHIF